MRKSIVNLIAELYEILLRFAVFLAVSLWMLPHIMAASFPWTHALWITVFHWVTGLAEVVLPLLLLVPIFAPEAFVEFINRASEGMAKIVAFFDSVNRVKNPLTNPLKGFSFAQRLSFIDEYLSALKVVNVNNELKEPLRVAAEGLETAKKLIEEPDLVMAPLSDPCEDLGALFGGSPKTDLFGSEPVGKKGTGQGHIDFEDRVYAVDNSTRRTIDNSLVTDSTIDGITLEENANAKHL